MKSESSAFSSITKPICLLFWLSLPMLRASGAESYQGASAVLQDIAAQSAKSTTNTPETDERSKLRNDLKSFEGASAGLAPDEAATRWLALADRAAKLQAPTMPGQEAIQPVSSGELLAALPPPAVWPELAKAIAARPAAKGEAQIREIGLQLLAAALMDDKAARQRAIDALQAKAAKSDDQTSFIYRNIIEQLNTSMLALTDDPDAIIKSLERQLNSGADNPVQLMVPNLVSIAGADKAEAFLRRALKQRNVILQFNQPNETSRLAQKVALEMMDQLGAPQWGLINSLDSTVLYEAMDKRFGNHDADDSSSQTPALPGMPRDYMTNPQKAMAGAYYFLGLISQGRSKDAVALAKKSGANSQPYMFEEAFTQMERAGYTSALDDFFFELLSQDPGLPFWDEYVALAAKSGQTERMVKLARSAAADEDLTSGKKASIHENLAKALLAADQLDEGVTELRALITNNASESENPSGGSGSLAVSLARVGMLVNRPEWTEEGITAARNWLHDNSSQNSVVWESPMVAGSLAAILLDLNRGPEAEAVLKDALTGQVKASSQQPYGWSQPSGSAQLLTELCLLYDKAGRSADVVALLEQAPYWGVSDLNALFELKAGENRVSLAWLHVPPATYSLPCLAARALAGVGRKEEALKITQALLDHEPGLDRGYELLLSLGDSNIIGRLDELFSRDQFEERPLIWKAHVLKQQGQLEEAEKVARQAISIDPSDGEEGPGDRMRAYSELADICALRGDTNDAQIYRGAVTAIRLSEQADQYFMAGLLKRAVKMYEDSLTHFADAYCIQSRLAIQLSALGLNDQAAEHYRRAYELMPDSFGRVESHCFGCERAFEGQRAQGIAEQVFTKFVAERPDKPQVHYLLGYLREEQEKYNEAATNYLAAVKLDPDYLNAWVRLQGVSANIIMPAAQRDQILFNILRLDPTHRHAGPDSFQATDLKELWNVVAAGASRQPPETPPLLTLSASKLAMANNKNNSQNPMRRFMYYDGENPLDRGISTPGSIIAETPLVMAAGQMICNANGNGSDD
jgi:tetratricopeptide (TPR) repeat protein